MTPDTLQTFVAQHGLWLMAAAAILEGPLVTIAAGALVAKGTLGLPAVLAIATAADLTGDAALWLAGRHLRRLLPHRLRRRMARNTALRSLRQQAGRVLIMGKLTHSAGAIVLLAAGMARVPFARFLGFNLIATLPKVAACTAIGWAFGHSLTQAGFWLTTLSAACLVMALGLMALWLRTQGKPRCASPA